MDLTIITERDKLIELCNSGKCEVPEIETSHEFVDGMYIRTTRVNKGTVVVGATHKKDGYNILLSGSIIQIDGDNKYEVSAPITIVSKAGSNRTAIALEDTVYMSIFNVDSETIKDVEKELFEEEIFDEKVARDKHDYYKMLESLGIDNDEVVKDMDAIGYEDSSSPFFYIDNSKIEGEGLFSSGILNGDMIGLAIKDGKKQILGRKVNHSIEPNIVLIGAEVYAIKDIPYGEELTFDYMDNIEKGL